MSYPHSRSRRFSVIFRSARTLASLASPSLLSSSIQALPAAQVIPRRPSPVTNTARSTPCVAAQDANVAQARSSPCACFSAEAGAEPAKNAPRAKRQRLDTAHRAAQRREAFLAIPEKVNSALSLRGPCSTFQAEVGPGLRAVRRLPSSSPCHCPLRIGPTSRGPGCRRRRWLPRPKGGGSPARGRSVNHGAPPPPCAPPSISVAPAQSFRTCSFRFQQGCRARTL